ncbi:hypothetical protein GN157_09605 [Flavobacterium rakeshii]|uniref:HEAT repeat domain-containing protein n=1 Tax=Flavobacterium rakeshii TaxID=1038845 RepID=A0A6N8HCK5_9FLAO|nr:HEAT repeat domain-containing protein [Flavobacterium rakeshii]MEE1899820.1 HEAT repeat domain-containing protein [Flavobacterium rakeshii]MUV03962.1 hypothetical protein [Flavobacterium rakeshii]
MEKFYDYIYYNSGLEWIVNVNILISLLFLLLILLLILFILYLRVYKNLRNIKKAEHVEKLTDFINGYLFDTEFEEASIEEFRAHHVRSKLQKKVTTKEILIYSQNFKGEANASIKKLFFRLELDGLAFKEIASRKWYLRARGMHTVSNMGIKIQESTAVRLLNDKRVEVRLQSLLYFIKLSQKYPLNFLYRLEEPLTIWQQIHIEDALKGYKEEIPDFSKWLNHKQPTVIGFCIKQISAFDQYENVEKVIPFLEHPEEMLKKEAVRCMRKMGNHESVDIVLTNFASENNTIKKEILKLIKEVGSYNQLQTLSYELNGDNEEIKIEYLKAEEYFLK